MAGGLAWPVSLYLSISLADLLLNQGQAYHFKVGGALVFIIVVLVLAVVPICWPTLNERHCWWYAAASAGLLGASWAFSSLNHNVVAIALFVGAMVLGAWPLRGPIPERTVQKKLLVVGSLFCSEVLVGIFVTEFDVMYVSQPVDLLLVMFLGLSVLGVCFSLAMTFSRGQPIAAPIAFGMITVILAALTLQGLGPLFKDATPPDVNGAGLLFTDAPRSQPIQLTAFVNNTYATPPLDFAGFRRLTGEEAVQLSIAALPAYRPVRWALLLIGDARLDLGCSFCGEQPSPEGLEHLPDVTGWGGTPAPADLFWGTLHNGDQEVFNGTPVTSYVNATPSQDALSLPLYGEGFHNVDGGTLEKVRKVLSTQPVLRANGDFTITTAVEPGPTLLNTVINAIPPLINPGKLQWQNNSQLSVSYVMLNQNTDNDVRNALFILSVVLGGAAGGLMASWQRVLEIVQKRKAPDGSD